MEGLPTADVAVRQALMGALDLQELMSVQTAGNGALRQGLAELLPKACPGDTVGAFLTAGADLEAAGQLLDEAGWVMGSDGVREKDGAPLTIRAFYVTSIENSALSMELAMAQWQELGVDVQLQGVDEAQFSTIAFETRAWDVFLAALNLDVPSVAVPFVSGPQPPDGVNFSAVANPEYEAARRRGERPHRRGGVRGVERRRGRALRPDEHPAVRRHHGAVLRQRRRVRSRSPRDHRQQPATRGGLAHHHRGDGNRGGRRLSTSQGRDPRERRGGADIPGRRSSSGDWRGWSPACSC